MYLLLLLFIFFMKTTMHQPRTFKTHSHASAYNPTDTWSDDEPVLKGPRGKNASRLMQLEDSSLSCPIAAASIKRNECAHLHSMMRAAEPFMFLRFPYRSSLMTLLRRVATVSTDTMANMYNCDPPLVYAGYQNHWNSDIGCPVLTIVGVCNSNIAPPIVTRNTYDYATVTCMASSKTEQHLVEFKIPLLQLIDTCNQRIVVEVTSALDIDDQLVTYIVHASNPKEPMVMIKLWNLSPTGCSKLHIQSVYEVPRVEITDEYHILGLSGDRSTSFHINFPYIKDPVMRMLEELDLQAIGYRTKRDSRPYIKPTEFGIPPNSSDRTLMPRMTPQKTTFRDPNGSNHIIVPKRSVKFQGKIHVKPLFYPPAINHKPGMPYGNIKPVLFPAGFSTYRNLHYDNLVTVKDIARDLAFNTGSDNLEDGIRQLSDQYGILIQIVRQNLLTPFSDFCENNKHNRFLLKKLPYFIRDQVNSRMPNDWVEPSKHLILSINDNMVYPLDDDIPIPNTEPSTSQNTSAIVNVDSINPTIGYNGPIDQQLIDDTDRWLSDIDRVPSLPSDPEDYTSPSLNIGMTPAATPTEPTAKSTYEDISTDEDESPLPAYKSPTQIADEIAARQVKANAPEKPSRLPPFATLKRTASYVEQLPFEIQRIIDNLKPQTSIEPVQENLDDTVYPTPMIAIPPERLSRMRVALDKMTKEDEQKKQEEQKKKRESQKRAHDM